MFCKNDNNNTDTLHLLVLVVTLQLATLLTLKEATLSQCKPKIMSYVKQ